MISVSTKDEKEGLEYLLRRFNKKVALSGILLRTKEKMFFVKPLPRKVLRTQAIKRKIRKTERNNQYKF
jgi:ribosomal protein S21